MSSDEDDQEELRVAARERIEDMPGETALGNPDPAAGGHGDPKEYQGNETPGKDE
ncbi:hypothetical protein [Actinoplanes friuliensis]|jgi:hypothetical protein|uniref:hypothetical protein n=1 Tax=Actinoplanes friuliensis TaxID=196914 RepID=UPI000428566A|nr:hypothetical protein [Actinoplanes friuliensis]